MTIVDPRDIAQRVFDESDNTIRVKPLGSSVAKDKKRGSDCTGSDGEKNRVLTLSNITTTTAVIVIVNQAGLIEDEDYTVTHNTTGSTIEFLNKIADVMFIEVSYFT